MKLYRKLIRYKIKVVLRPLKEKINNFKFVTFPYCYNGFRAVRSGFAGWVTPAGVEKDADGYPMYGHQIWEPFTVYAEYENTYAEYEIEEYYACGEFGNGAHIPLPILLNQTPGNKLQKLALWLAGWRFPKARNKLFLFCLSFNGDLIEKKQIYAANDKEAWDSFSLYFSSSMIGYKKNMADYDVTSQRIKKSESQPV